jgi:hypothetical protein
MNCRHSASLLKVTQSFLRWKCLDADWRWHGGVVALRTRHAGGGVDKQSLFFALGRTR